MSYPFVTGLCPRWKANERTRRHCPSNTNVKMRNPEVDLIWDSSWNTFTFTSKCLLQSIVHIVCLYQVEHANIDIITLLQARLLLFETSKSLNCVVCFYLHQKHYSCLIEINFFFSRWDQSYANCIDSSVKVGKNKTLRL